LFVEQIQQRMFFTFLISLISILSYFDIFFSFIIVVRKTDKSYLKFTKNVNIIVVELMSYD